MDMAKRLLRAKAEQTKRRHPHNGPVGTHLVKLIVRLSLVLTSAELIFRYVCGFGDPVVVETDPIIEYQLVASKRYRRFHNDIFINSHRMRSREFEWDKVDEARVLLVGDSIVYGDHHLDQTATISAQLEQQLATMQCPALVMAAATSSWGPKNELEFLNRYGFFHAQAVVVVLSTHDHLDYPSFNNWDIPYALTPAWTAVSDVVHRVFTWGVKWATPSVQLAPLNREQLSLVALQQLLALATVQAPWVEIQVHPTRHELETGKFFGLEYFTRHAQPFNLPISPTYSPTLTSTAQRLYADDIHPSKLGARLIAQSLAKRLRPHLQCAPE